MAIIVVGSQKYRKTCGNCGSELEYSYSDVQEYKTNMDYLGDYNLVKGIKCPVCNTVLTHSTTRPGTNNETPSLL